MKTLKRKLCAILCATLLAGLLAPTASAATFTDTSSHWAASYIQRCADLGIVDGIGGGKFEPENPVTNAEFVKMLCAAFYTPGSEAYQISNAAEVSAYYGGNVPWYGLRSYYFKECGLLNGVDYDILSPDSANRPMNRNNMAQAAANVLENQIISVSEAQQTTAQSAIPDYYNIPEINRSAVKVCYALGVIQGTDGGKFDGGSTMTRAQACTVITRLLDAVDVAKADKPAPLPTPSTPVDQTSEYKDVEVTTSTMSMGTAYHITDNGFGTGKLNNGKDINEANILELLDKAKTIWPTGMTWAARTVTSGNNWYANPSSTMRNINCNNFACGGFAALLSDYIYGHSGNPARRVNGFENIRVGDTIMQLDSNGSPKHAMTVVGINRTNLDTGYLFLAEGNISTFIRWPDTTNRWDSLGPDDLAVYGSYIAYTRWPD